MSTTVSSVKVASLRVSSTGTVLTKILKGTVSVVLAATAAAAEEDVSLTITGAAAGDIVIMTPLDASVETGVAVVAAWVSAADTVKVRISNLHTNTLTGSTAAWSYCIIKS
jgi:hypothetical protein